MTSNFCTGTLLKGPGDKIYVLSAYHCLAFMGKRFMYPWSTFSIIFDYKLPCNASYVEDVPRTFDRYLTGLAVVFQDVYSDVGVFELLQDIPPEWGVVLAGWEAANLGSNFTYTCISQPAGDVQKIAYGKVYNQIPSVILDAVNEEVDVYNVSCSTHACNFYATHVQHGSMTHGSSGAGMFADELGKIMGVLSTGRGSVCPGTVNKDDPRPSRVVFGSLGGAWEHGLHRIFNRSVEDEGGAEFEEYTRALPTITVGNIVPEVNPRKGSTSFSIALQQEPDKDTTISLTPTQTDLVSVTPQTLTFTRSNWRTPQFVSVTAVPGRAHPEATLQFDVALTWPVVSEAGGWSSRTKTISGVVWAERKGNSFFNPQEVRVPFRHVMDLERYNPQIPLIMEHNGPFIPAKYFVYTAQKTEGVAITVCPHERGSKAQKMTLELLDATWSTENAILHNQTEVDSPRPGCSRMVAALRKGETYYFVAHPRTQVTIPGQSKSLNGKASMTIASMPLAEAVTESLNPTRLRIPAVPSHAVLPITIAPVLAWLDLEEDHTLNITTCSNKTDVGAEITVMDDQLEVIRTTGLARDNACVSIPSVVVEGGRRYFISITPVQYQFSLGKKTHQVDIHILDA
ncbi:hypothetical protein ACKKBF_B05785 [Auxenochlorella protothecoides x Auxenochlorella symbiontica]